MTLGSSRAAELRDGLRHEDLPAVARERSTIRSVPNELEGILLRREDRRPASLCSVGGEPAPGDHALRPPRSLARGGYSGEVVTLDGGVAEQAANAGRAPEAEALYRTLTAEDPHDVEAWLQLGEVLYHYNMLYGRRPSEARAPLERALALEPTSREIMMHLIEMAVARNDQAAYDTLAAHFLAGSLPGHAEPTDAP